MLAAFFLSLLYYIACFKFINYSIISNKCGRNKSESGGRRGDIFIILLLEPTSTISIRCDLVFLLRLTRRAVFCKLFLIIKKEKQMHIMMGIRTKVMDSIISCEYLSYIIGRRDEVCQEDEDSIHKRQPRDGERIPQYHLSRIIPNK